MFRVDNITAKEHTSFASRAAVRCVPGAIMFTEESSCLSKHFIRNILRLELPEDFGGDVGCYGGATPAGRFSLKLDTGMEGHPSRLRGRTCHFMCEGSRQTLGAVFSAAHWIRPRT